MNIKPSVNRSNLSLHYKQNKLKHSKGCVLVTGLNFTFIDDLLNITHGFIKLCRILNFICRFIYNLKNPKARKVHMISIHEVGCASNLIVRSDQISKFFIKFKNCQKKRNQSYQNLKSVFLSGQRQYSSNWWLSSKF